MIQNELEIIESRTDKLPMADFALIAEDRPRTVAKLAAAANLPLFDSNDAQDFRSRWDAIQIGFVDEPRTAVQQADELVASAIKKLAELFAAERQKMEAAWAKTEDVTTEDLRLALNRYRSFFNRLLAV